ncbi:hypothetical protein D3C72_2532680 [compost metagenome]
MTMPLIIQMPMTNTTATASSICSCVDSPAWRRVAPRSAVTKKPRLQEPCARFM